MSNRMLFIYGAISCVMILVLLYAWDRERKRKRNTLQEAKMKRADRTRNYLYPFYYLFNKIPLCRKSFEKIKRQIKLVYPGEMIEINLRVTKDMLKSLVAAGALLLFFLFTAKGDVYYIGVGFMFSYVMYTHMVNTRYERADKKLLYQFYDFLSDVRHNYYISQRKVDDAVYMSIDDSPYEMSLHATKIYKILRSIEIDKEVDRYVSISPNRFILSFVAIATSVMEYSDKILDNGKSMFLTNIGYLKEEVHAEMDKIKKSESLFKFRAGLAILPVLMIKPIQNWANEYLPELADFYTGIYGIMTEVLIMAASFICYTLVMNLKDRNQKEVRDHALLEKISQIPFVSKLLTKETNRNFSKSERINDKLKLTGEHMGYKQFLLKRVLYAVGLFVVFQLLMVTALWQERRNILTDFSNAFSTSFISTQEYEEQMEAAARMYVDALKHEEKIDAEAVQREIMENTPVKRPQMAQLVVQAVVEKINTYNDVYYRWWYMLIAAVVMALGYKLPMFMLDYRIKTIRMGMEDEVVQYQTIVMMLMHTDNITVKIMLEWIERFAYCFKESINACINELPHDEEKALKKLRDSETFHPFKRFINNFLCIDKQGIVAAFDEIVQDHENAIEDRKTDNEIITEKKAMRATFICVIPGVIEIAMYLIYPIMSLADHMTSYTTWM